MKIHLINPFTKKSLYQSKPSKLQDQLDSLQQEIRQVSFSKEKMVREEGNHLYEAAYANESQLNIIKANLVSIKDSIFKHQNGEYYVLQSQYNALINQVNTLIQEEILKQLDHQDNLLKKINYIDAFLQKILFAEGELLTIVFARLERSHQKCLAEQHDLEFLIKAETGYKKLQRNLDDITIEKPINFIRTLTNKIEEFALDMFFNRGLMVKSGRALNEPKDMVSYLNSNIQLITRLDAYRLMALLEIPEGIELSKEKCFYLLDNMTVLRCALKKNEDLQKTVKDFEIGIVKEYYKSFISPLKKYSINWLKELLSNFEKLMAPHLSETTLLLIYGEERAMLKGRMVTDIHSLDLYDDYPYNDIFEELLKHSYTYESSFFIYESLKHIEAFMPYMQKIKIKLLSQIEHVEACLGLAKHSDFSDEKGLIFEKALKIDNQNADLLYAITKTMIENGEVCFCEKLQEISQNLELSSKSIQAERSVDLFKFLDDVFERNDDMLANEFNYETAQEKFFSAIQAFNELEEAKEELIDNVRALVKDAIDFSLQSALYATTKSKREKTLALIEKFFKDYHCVKNGINKKFMMPILLQCYIDEIRKIKAPENIKKEMKQYWHSKLMSPIEKALTQQKDHLYQEIEKIKAEVILYHDKALKYFSADSVRDLVISEYQNSSFHMFCFVNSAIRKLTNLSYDIRNVSTPIDAQRLLSDLKKSFNLEGDKWKIERFRNKDFTSSIDFISDIDFSLKPRTPQRQDIHRTTFNGCSDYSSRTNYSNSSYSGASRQSHSRTTTRYSDDHSFWHNASSSRGGNSHDTFSTISSSVTSAFSSACNGIGGLFD